MQVYTTNQLAQLESGLIIKRDLIALYLDSGTYGFAHGMAGEMTWNSIIFKGSGNLIEIERPSSRTGVSASTIKLRLRSGVHGSVDASITPTVLSTIFSEKYRGRKFIQWIARFDSNSYQLIDNPKVEFEGRIESISQKTEDGVSYLEGVVQEGSIDMTSRGWAMANDAHHQRVSPGDSFFKHSASAGRYAVYWGQPQPANSGAGKVLT